MLDHAATPMTVAILCGLVYVASLASAYPTGAPESTCETLTPGHYPIQSLENDGCRIEVVGAAGDTVTPGSTYTVRLTGCNQEFKGFHLQCRDVTTNTATGTFTLGPEVNGRTLNCAGGQQNALTHVGSDLKTSIEVPWTVPDTCSSPVQCRATVVASFTQVRYGVRSPVLTCGAAVGKCGPNENFQECGSPQCESTCQGAPCQCTEQCQLNACVCNEGYVRHEGNCVLPSECPVPGTRPGLQVCSCTPQCSARGTASYRVEFQSTWRRPPPPPSGHWSRLVGGAHSPCAVVWRNGTTATTGLKDVAELGSTFTLLGEVNRLNCYSGDRIRSGGLGDATGSLVDYLNVDRNNFLLSAAAMIAPSPDWFVGFDSIPVCIGSSWVERLEFDAFLWDAGTDSGLTFTARNSVTRPFDIVQRIRSDTDHLATSFVGYPNRLGVFTIIRQSVNPTAPVSHTLCRQCSSDVQCHPSYDSISPCSKPYQVFKECGSACPESCDKSIHPCPAICIQGCFCQDEYVMNNSRCIRREDCPVEATTEPPTPSCPANEVHDTCGTACPETCDGAPFACTAQCVVGCRCASGFVRHEGSCIARESCPVEAPTEPPTPSCPANEVHDTCGTACPETCDGTPFACTQQCVFGCRCASGFVRHEGSCIERASCPVEATTEPPTPSCPANEVHDTCGTACPETCDGAPFACTQQCVVGCRCASGFVRHEGSCIARESCPVEAPTEPPTPSCAANEVYDTCGTACPETCDGTPFGCIFQCVVGCRCASGFVRHEGSCIERASCPVEATTEPPTPSCPANEVHDTCGTACPETCNGRPFVCTLQCVIGCRCASGFVRHEGACIERESCPAEATTEPPTPSCPANEVHDTCGTACPETCDGTPFACTKQCVVGCRCASGFVRHEGSCIERGSCPVEATVSAPPTPSCPANEVHDTCGTACPETCDGTPFACTFQCVFGCRCASGFVRHEGACIERESCPAEATTEPPTPSCPANEVHDTCGTACPETCDGTPFACTKQCVVGCRCASGFVRHEGSCIERGSCPVEATVSAPPTPSCPANEVHDTCGTACPETCDGTPFACTFQCVFGCRCASGFVRHEGACIERESCPAEATTEPPTPSCPANEVHDTCGTACPETCDGTPFACTKQCVVGCRCASGFVRHEGSCIERRSCPVEATVSAPPTPSCPANEVHDTCGTACPETCDGTPFACTFQCVFGCRCASGFVRHEGACIERESCPVEATTEPPTPSCPANEVHDTCGTACPETCDGTPFVCTEQCVVGCRCASGFVKHAGSCIARESCPAEVPATCRGIQCGIPVCPPDRTLNYTITEESCCPFCSLLPREERCRGIFCDLPVCPPGSRIDYTTEACCPGCSPVEEPPAPSCPANEVHDTCGTACPETCDGTPFACTKQCVIGCRCANGFVRHDGSCIARETCRTRQLLDVVTTAADPCASVTCQSKPTCKDGVAPIATQGPCCTQYECPACKDHCFADKTCGQYHEFGQEEDKCCPSCRTKLSACPGITCSPIRGCLRYESSVRTDECCLRCARLRRRINNNPRAICADVLCPRGSVCQGRNRIPACICRKCKPNFNPFLRVLGSDGTIYDSLCHQLREACLRREYLGQ